MLISLYNIRNRQHEFRSLLNNLPLLNSMGVSFTEDTYADFTFVNHRDYMDYKVSFEESCEKGIKLVKSLHNPVLFDSSDSTALVGSVEVLEGANAIGLLKNQLLDIGSYEIQSAFGKWWYKQDLNYKNYSLRISPSAWSKILLSGLNIFYWNKYIYCTSPAKKQDVFVGFQISHTSKFKWLEDENFFYKKSRQDILNSIPDLYKFNTKRLGYSQYLFALKTSHVCISPFGMGELCLRDIEAMFSGCKVLKQRCGRVRTCPNYIPYLQDFHSFDLFHQHDIDFLIQKNDKLDWARNYIENETYLKETENQWIKIIQFLSSV